MKTGNGDSMTQTTKATVVKAVAKKLLNTSLPVCKYVAQQGGSLIKLSEKSSTKEPTWRLAYLGGTISRVIPVSDKDEYSTFTPEHDSEGIDLFLDLSYSEETALFTATTQSDFTLNSNILFLCSLKNSATSLINIVGDKS